MNHVYSVGQINQYIRNLFGQDFLLNKVSVRGEITGLKDHPSGHLYFTLKEGNSVLSAVMFAGSRRTGLKTVPKEGMKVIVTGNVDIYEAAGKYQLYAKEITPDGEGEGYRQFLLLKQKLEEMGMFDPLYKKPIPKYSLTVGIVTSPSGAALQDIIRVTKERNPYVQLILSPALVQGEAAPESIVRAIRKMDALHPDVMIVGRGGGSFEDLNCFNDESVAHAIFDAETPIISAVGHEVDFTIADFTADYRAATPSQAAEIAVFDRKTFENLLNQYRLRQAAVVREKTEAFKHQIRAAESALKAVHPKTRVRDQIQKADESYSKLLRLIQDQIEERKKKVEALSPRLSFWSDRLFREKQHAVQVAAARLNGLSPLEKLKNGYGYLEIGNEPVRSARELKAGDPLQVVLHDGRVTTEVLEVKGNES